MANWVLDPEGQFIEVGQSLLGVLLGSLVFFLAPRVFLALRWTMQEKVLGEALDLLGL
jgi:hypothetical protein